MPVLVGYSLAENGLLAEVIQAIDWNPLVLIGLVVKRFCRGLIKRYVPEEIVRLLILDLEGKIRVPVVFTTIGLKKEFR